MSVTALPRSMSGEGTARCSGRREGDISLLVGNGRKVGEPALSGTAGRWQDKCHPLPIWRHGSLAAKETRGDD